MKLDSASLQSRNLGLCRCQSACYLHMFLLKEKWIKIVYLWPKPSSLRAYGFLLLAENIITSAMQHEPVPNGTVLFSSSIAVNFVFLCS